MPGGPAAGPNDAVMCPKLVANGKAQRVGQLPANQTMRFDIGNSAARSTGLDIFYQELYDPTTPFYAPVHHAEEFTARFGPTEQDWKQW